MPRSPDKVVN
jgi:hypothetical protein